jgi:hypothetical protein
MRMIRRMMKRREMNMYIMKMRKGRKNRLKLCLNKLSFRL